MRQDDPYLRPAAFIDSDAPSVKAFAEAAVAGISGTIPRALALYLAVRDRIAYEAYLDFSRPETYRASRVLADGKGFCVGKAALLAAWEAYAREVGVVLPEGPQRVVTRPAGR